MIFFFFCSFSPPSPTLTVLRVKLISVCTQGFMQCWELNLCLPYTKHVFSPLRYLSDLSKDALLRSLVFLFFGHARDWTQSLIYTCKGSVLPLNYIPDPLKACGVRTGELAQRLGMHPLHVGDLSSVPDTAWYPEWWCTVNSLWPVLHDIFLAEDFPRENENIFGWGECDLVVKCIPCMQDTWVMS